MTHRTEITADEMVNSLTGFDEIAIGKHFDGEIFTLKKRPLTFLRALIFVAHRREGMDDHAAREAALTLTLGEVGEWFAADPVEPMPEEPITDPGKDSSPPA